VQSYTKTIIHEDWVCDKCKNVNFSKRETCFSCKEAKTEKSLIIPVVKQRTYTVEQRADEESDVRPFESRSLIVRGDVLKDISNEKEIEGLFLKNH